MEQLKKDAINIITNLPDGADMEESRVRIAYLCLDWEGVWKMLRDAQPAMITR